MKLFSFFRRNRLIAASVTSLAASAAISGLLIAHVGGGGSFTPIDFQVTCHTNTQGYCTVLHDFNGTVPTLTVTVDGPTSGQPVLPDTAQVTNTKATEFTVRVYSASGAPYPGTVTLDVAALAAQLIGAVEDTDIGVGASGYVLYNERAFVPAGWSTGTGLGTDGYTSTGTPGNSLTLNFTGEQARVYGLREPAGGVSSVSLDNGPATLVSNYSAAAQVSLLYTTNWLVNGSHTLKFTLLNTAGLGHGFRMSFDRASLYNLVGWDSGSGPTSTGGAVPTVGNTSTLTPVPSPTLTVSPTITTRSPTPSVSPSTTSASPTATSTGGGGGGGPLDVTSNIDACPNTPDASGSPGSNTFSGHTYNGNNATIGNSSTTFTVASNTCIENYTIQGSLILASGASNVIIVNNKFTTWPSSGAIRAIDGLLTGGSDLTINYNSFSPQRGGAWTTTFGEGGINSALNPTTGRQNGLTMDHNFFAGNFNIDSIQLKCTHTCNNLDMSYNRFTNTQSFTVELQQIVHTLTFEHNYADYTSCGTRSCGGQFSISFSNESPTATGTYPYNDSATGVDVGYNIEVASTSIESQIGGTCAEIRGTGANLHDNYCLHYHDVCNYANTNSSTHPGMAWFAQNNVTIGGGSGTCWAEGSNSSFAQPGYPNVAPSGTNTNVHYSESGSYPALPAWSYDNGAQW